MSDGNREGAAGQLVRLGSIEAWFGNTTAARDLAREALTLSDERFVLGAAGETLAEAGYLDDGAAAIERAAAQFPATDTLGQHLFLPGRRASLELARGHAAAGLAALTPSEPYDGVVRPYNRFTRARIRAALGQTAEAIADFRHIIEFPIPYISAITPFARLGLARTATKSGDIATAKREYQDLLAIWKDADADLPTVKRAREEYAALQ
jgi:hypothetical protein